MNTEDTGEENWEIVQSTEDLKSAINRLERRSTVIEDDLQEKFHEILNVFKPANILKTTLREVQESIPLKHNLLKVALGLGTGYFSSKLIVGKSDGIVKKALGTALQFGITHLIGRKKNDSEKPVSDRRISKKSNILQRIRK